MARPSPTRAPACSGAYGGPTTSRRAAPALASRAAMSRRASTAAATTAVDGDHDLHPNAQEGALCASVSSTDASLGEQTESAPVIENVPRAGVLWHEGLVCRRG